VELIADPMHVTSIQQTYKRDQKKDKKETKKKMLTKKTYESDLHIWQETCNTLLSLYSATHCTLKRPAVCKRDLLA